MILKLKPAVLMNGEKLSIIRIIKVARIDRAEQHITAVGQFI